MISALRRRFATRLATAAFAVGAALVGVTGVISYRQAAGALQARLLSQLGTDATDDARRLGEWLAQQKAAVSLLASQIPADELDRPRAAPRGWLVEGLLLNSGLLAAEEVQLVRVPGGRVVRSTVPASEGTFVVDQLHYAKAQGGLYLQPIYPAAPTGRPRLTVAAPVRREDGTVVAVLAAHLDLARMEDVLARSGEAVPVDAYLVNRFAEFVSARRFGRDGVKRGVHSRAIDDALEGSAAAALYTDYAGRPVVGAWRWIPDLELAIVREVPLADAFSPARALLVRSVLVGLGAMLVLAVGVTIITQRFAKPVREVAEAASAVARGDFSVVAPVTSQDEVGELARAFNAMTSRLQAVYGELDSQVKATRTALSAADENRALLQDVVNATPSLVLVVGTDDRVLLGNARLASLAGLPAEALVGRHVAGMVGDTAAPLGALAAFVREVRSRGIPVTREVSLGRAPDVHAWQVSAFPLADSDGQPYAVAIVGADLTERERAEASRRAQDARVQQAQKLESLGVMAGGIAHDFNNLLGAILGNVELARGAHGDAAETADALEQISAATRRATELTRQMLAYAGRASLRRETVDVRSVVRDLVPLARAGQSKKVTFVERPHPAPLWIDADPAQLSQVLLNLVTNAAEAFDDASGTVTVTTSDVAPVPPPSDAAPHGWVRLTVTDTGPGISPDVRERMFDPFFTTKAQGRGLGLSAVRGIVQSLGGVLALESAPGKGTRFDICFPAASPPVATGTARVAPRPSAISGTVLVVDDETAIRAVVRRTLTRRGCVVLEAQDGAEGLAVFLANADALALVVLDLTMPGMGGAEVLAAIRATHPALPVVVASGYDLGDSLSGIGSDPYVRLLQKPYTTAALEAAASEAMALRPRGSAPAA
jgi:two-component system, cell cycle sensor histidine kinase and response regulator CckA